MSRSICTPDCVYHGLSSWNKKIWYYIYGCEASGSVQIKSHPLDGRWMIRSIDIQATNSIFYFIMRFNPRTWWGQFSDLKIKLWIFLKWLRKKIRVSFVVLATTLTVVTLQREVFPALSRRCIVSLQQDNSQLGFCFFVAFKRRTWQKGIPFSSNLVIHTMYIQS